MNHEIRQSQSFLGTAPQPVPSGVTDAAAEIQGRFDILCRVIDELMSRLHPVVEAHDPEQSCSDPIPLSHAPAVIMLLSHSALIARKTEDLSRFSAHLRV